MKKYNMPSLEAYELDVKDVITTSGVSQFVKDATATNDNANTVAPQSTSWNNSWQID